LYASFLAWHSPVAFFLQSTGFRKQHCLRIPRPRRASFDTRTLIGLQSERYTMYFRPAQSTPLAQASIVDPCSTTT